ncbi:DedA family protein [Sinomonas mesophila]|uniref:DedA family protein n=1 Tax=Sinomonas mesophila TaxID=1531955 RepID=UPI0009857925|nr:DedA family protein [Sinomonas mesophila]
MEQINEAILAAAGQGWVPIVLFAFCTIDGFFPPVPSESLVVGLSSVAASAGLPNAWALFCAAAVGAFVGDNIAYTIGRAVGVHRWRWMRSLRMQAAFRWAGRELRKRAASLIMVARFIPVGRVAVNFTAGATHYPRSRFVPLTALSAVLWAGYSVFIGLFFGQWFKGNHLIGATIAIVCAVALGIAIDIVISRVRGTLPIEEEPEPATPAETRLPTDPPQG